MGALPSAGGNRSGGDAGYGFDAQNKNRFYCAHIVDLFEANYDPKKSHLTSNPIIDWAYLPLRYGRPNIFRRISRAIFNALSTSYLAKTYIFSSIDNLTGKGFVAEKDIAIVALVTPNIKFHISAERLRKDFRQDGTYPVGFAYSTDKWISPINSGLIGVIWNSLTFKTFERMKNDPKKVLIGLTQIGVAAGAAALVYRFALPAIQEHRPVAVIGTVMAVI